MLAFLLTLVLPAPRAAEPSELDRLRGAMAVARADGGVMYRLAQALARAGQGAEAVRWLKTALDQGLDLDLGDAAFLSLRDRADFQEQLARAVAVKPVSRSRVAFRIPARELIPEGIAWDARTGHFFVGSLYERRIVRVTPEGHVSDFATRGPDGLEDVLGLKVDPVRRRLWACTAASGRTGSVAGSSALFEYDLDTGKLLKARWLREPGTKHLLNDLAFTTAGEVFVTDSDANTVWRLAPGGEALEVLVAGDTFLYPNGIALSADEKRLYVADFKNGLSSLDLAGRTTTPLPHPGAVSTAGIDGLYRDGNELVAVQNGAGRDRIVRYRLSASGDRVEGLEVLESRNPLFRIPTTGVVAGDDFVYLANANLEALDEDGNLKKGAHLEEVVVLRAPLR
jgi:sugar lactone lactonase YvrE